MGNRTKRAIRLAAPLALGVAVAIVAAVWSDRIPALDYVLALSWAPAFVLSLLLIGAVYLAATLSLLINPIMKKMEKHLSIEDNRSTHSPN
jgi:predicted acyltransferase